MKKVQFDLFTVITKVEDKIIREDELFDIFIIHLLKLKEQCLYYYPPSANIRLRNMSIQNPFHIKDNYVLNSFEEEIVCQTLL